MIDTISQASVDGVCRPGLIEHLLELLFITTRCCRDFDRCGASGIGVLYQLASTIQDAHEILDFVVDFEPLLLGIRSAHDARSGVQRKGI